MANSIDKLDIDLDGIGHTLSDNKLMVPVYQRSYAWEEKHVKELYNDLFSAIKESEGEYFIGSVVLTTGKDRSEVVDGQQRLATTSILIAAIRDYFHEGDDKERAEDLQNDYLSSRDRRSQEIIPNFSLNNNDHNFFYNHVILALESENKDVKPIRESHKRIKKAYSIAKEKH